MTNPHHSLKAMYGKIGGKSKRGNDVIEGDPFSQKNWKMGTGWYVGIDEYPTRDKELSDPARLERLMPGVVIPNDSEGLVNLIRRSLRRSRAETTDDELKALDDYL